MQTVHAKWHDGRVCLEGPIDWPEGTELEVRPVVLDREDIPRSQGETDRNADDVPFSDADVESTDPAAIARWVREFRSIPPLEFTDQEFEEWQAWRRTMREFEFRTAEQRRNRIMFGE